MAQPSSSSPSKPHLEFVATLSPSTPGRQWASFPHPCLPLAAVCGTDKTVRIYSLVDYRLLAVINGGHDRSVRSCAWKPNIGGNNKKELVLATGSFDATVGIWRADLDDECDVGSLGNNNSHEEGEGEEFEEEKWRFAVLLDGHESEVKSVAWSSSGSMLATCSRDKSIWIWEDLADGDDNFETVAVLQEHGADVKCLAWHPREECLASGSYDNTVRLWREDADDWGQVACLSGHEGTVWSIDWDHHHHHDGKQGGTTRLVSGSDDRTVRVWKRASEKSCAQPPSSSSVPSILRSTDADETWIEEAKLPGVHVLSIYSVTWSKRTGLIASTGADGRIAIYEETPDPDGESGWQVIEIVEAAHDEYEVNHVVWAEAKGEEVLLSTGDDGSVKVWCLKRS